MILGYYLDEPVEWEDLTYDKLEQFKYVIYLIAENYYLDGEREKGKDVVKRLKDKIMEIQQEKKENIRGRTGAANQGRRGAVNQNQNKLKINSNYSKNKNKNILMLIKFM